MTLEKELEQFMLPFCKSGVVKTVIIKRRVFSTWLIRNKKRRMEALNKRSPSPRFHPIEELNNGRTLQLQPYNTKFKIEPQRSNY